VQSNPVLNSAFQVWQRGTTFTVGAARPYTADRFQNQRGGLATGLTVSRQITNDTTNLPNVQYCARVQRDSGNASTAINYLWQNIESVNSIPFAGKTITWSFYARKGADYSAASDALGVNLVSGTGTDQNLLPGSYTGAVNVINTTATLTTTWQRFTYTSASVVPTNSTQLGFQIFYTPVGTAGAADYFEITGVQIDIGNVALPFRTYAGTIQGELAACQRYYQRFTGESNTALVATGLAYSTTAVNLILPLPVTLRTYPTGTVDYGNLRLTDNVATYTITAITLSADSGNKNLVNIAATGAVGLTQYRGYFLAGSGGANYIAFSAEL
jgi:hypothetical protein